MRGSRRFLGPPSRTPRKRSNMRGESRVLAGVKQTRRGGSGAPRKTPALDRRLASLAQVRRAIIACERCPRLRAYCLEVARAKKRAFQDQAYWGRPVPGFGDPDARLLVIGLAPAAHGGNRTGRVFTGDSSGSWLYEALHAHGFASQP